MLNPPADTVALRVCSALITMGLAAVPCLVMVGSMYAPSASTRQSPAVAAPRAAPRAPLLATGTVRWRGGGSWGGWGPLPRAPPVPPPLPPVLLLPPVPVLPPLSAPPVPVLPPVALPPPVPLLPPVALL